MDGSYLIIVLLFVAYVLYQDDKNHSEAYKKGRRDGESSGLFDADNDMMYDDTPKRQKNMTDQERKDYKKGYEESYWDTYTQRKKRK